VARGTSGQGRMGAKPVNQKLELAHRHCLGGWD
jgi:hypothetical protein